MKCPKCGSDVMMLLCRRDGDSGFLNELYYKCLACGYVSHEDFDATKVAKENVNKKLIFPQKRSFKNLQLKVVTLAIAVMVGFAVAMQIPVPVRVFATDVSLDPVKDILPYVSLVNFTLSEFSFNYSEGDMSLHVLADSASVVNVETEPNVTTCVMNLYKVFVGYQDSCRSFDMGFVNLVLTIKVRYQELIANIDASAYMPLWVAIVQSLTGQLP